MYLQDKELNTVLENYFESLNESINERSDFKNKNDIINFIKKTYKPGKKDDDSREYILIDFRNDESSYEARSIWIDDLGYADITSKDIDNIINKDEKYKNKKLNKEYIGYMKETSDDSNNNEEVIKYINKLSDLVLLAHDGGGTEFSIDKSSKKIYLYDHDYEFIPVPLSINDFIDLCKYYNKK